jgi:hypothetical protein
MAAPERMPQASRSPPALPEFLIANALPVTIAIGLFFASAPLLALKGILCALVIILLEYRAMVACRGPWSRAFVLYVAMVLFLLSFGIVTAWNQTVGDNPAGSWAARLDAGFRFGILGHVFGGIIGYPIILWANSLLAWPDKS